VSKFHDLFHAVLRTVQVTDIAENVDGLHVTAHICYNVEDLEEYVVGLERRIADLRAALDCIPAKRMLSFGSPYTLTFGEEALRKIDAAIDAAGEGKP